MPGKRIGVGAKCHANAGECRGIPVECKGVQSTRGRQGNAGECQRDVMELVQSARGMQENAWGM